MSLFVKLLGDFEIRGAAGQRLALPTRKTRALFAYLLVNADRPQPRQRLMEFLWGDRSEQQARHSLNQALLAIRKLAVADGPPLLDSDTQHVTLRGAMVSSDLARFRELVADDPRQAVMLYTGPFLDGLATPSPTVEEWLRGIRAELLETACNALDRVAEDAEQRGETEDAIDLARQLIALDPVSEGANYRLIRLLHGRGDRTSALRQYGTYAETLRNEFDVEPPEGLKALIEEIRGNVKSLDAAEGERTSSDLVSRLKCETASTPDVNQERLPGRFFPPSQLRDERPAIAVLPFRNSSGAVEGASFCDGISEDLIFSLSSFRWFSVLGRGSTFQYRGLDVDPRQIGSHLGARYVLDGSVRRIRSKLRTRAALLDTDTGEQLWREQFDVETDGVFDVLNQIVQDVVAAVELRLDSIEMHRALAKPPAHLGAYELVKRGYWVIYQRGAEGVQEAKRNFEQALDLDSNYAPACAGRSYCELLLAFTDFMDVRYEHLRSGSDWARRALALDSEDPRSLRYYGQTKCYLGHVREGFDAVSKAVEVCPSYASGYSGLAFGFDLLGRFDEAIPAVDRTVSLAPYDPILHRCIMSKAVAQYQMMDYEAAEAVTEYSLAVADWTLNNLLLLAILGQRGDRGRAAQQLAKIKRLFPEATLARMSCLLPFKDSAHREHLADGIVRAGWTDPAI